MAARFVAQSATDEDEGYGYSFDDPVYGVVASLMFEDGVLTSLRVVDHGQPPPTRHTDNLIRVRPVGPWIAEGALEAPALEGAWHEVSLKVLKPESSAGRSSTARVRFVGDQVDLELRGQTVRASCAWQ